MGQVKALWFERMERLQDRWALRAARARARLVTRYRSYQRRRLLRRHG